VISPAATKPIRFGSSLLEGKSLKIYMHEFSQYLEGLDHEDPVIRGKAARGLAKYSAAEWKATPDAVSAAVPALAKASRLRGTGPADGAFRAEATKALGNIGAESAAILSELLRLLQEDSDSRVRTEAAHGLGKLGAGAGTASQTLVVVMGDPASEDTLRGEAAWALARVAPLALGTAAALGAAADDKSGYVGVRAAEALWKATGEAGQSARALATRLDDPAVRHMAAQALNRIGPEAKGAVPALLIATKSEDRLFRESVLMALRRIDPEAAAKAGLITAGVDNYGTARPFKLFPKAAGRR
jgi:HEAT repeat protein